MSVQAWPCEGVSPMRSTCKKWVKKRDIGGSSSHGQTPLKSELILVHDKGPGKPLQPACPHDSGFRITHLKKERNRKVLSCCFSA